MLITTEDTRFNVPTETSEPDFYQWKAAEIDGCSYYVYVSAVKSQDSEIIRAGNFLIFNSQILVKFLSYPNWSVRRIDLFVKDLDNWPSFNSFRIESIHAGHVTNPINREIEIPLCCFETVDGVKHHTLDDSIYEYPLPVPMSQCYSAQVDR